MKSWLLLYIQKYLVVVKTEMAWDIYDNTKVWNNGTAIKRKKKTDTYAW
jgi:hypothetical protein